MINWRRVFLTVGIIVAIAAGAWFVSRPANYGNVIEALRARDIQIEPENGTPISLSFLNSNHTTKGDYRSITSDELNHILELPTIERLDLSDTGIEDTELNALTALRKIVILDLSSTPIGDKSGPIFCKFPKLEILNLAFSTIGPAGIQELTQSQSITKLDVSGTNLDDKALACIGKMTNLISLWVGSNPAVDDLGLTKLEQKSLACLVATRTSTDGRFLKSCNYEKSLEVLRLAHTKLVDANVRDFDRFRVLRYLDVSDTRITNATVLEISKAPNLELLGLDDTDVTDQCLDYLLAMKKLKLVGVHHTKLTDEAKRRLFEGGNIFSLDIDEEQFSMTPPKLFK